MSGQDVARQAIRTSRRPRRTLDEEVMVRVPALRRLGELAIQALAPRSRLRRAMVARRMRQVYEAFNRRDMEAFLILSSHPAVDFYTATDAAGVPFGLDLNDSYHGHEGLAAFARQWVAAWQDYRTEPEEIIDCGDRLVVLLRHRGRGRGSGVEIDQAFAQVVHLRRGLAVRIDTFWDPARALQAAGVRE
jgi:ketosteroid isomerase-like protein